MTPTLQKVQSRDSESPKKQGFRFRIHGTEGFMCRPGSKGEDEEAWEAATALAEWANKFPNGVSREYSPPPLWGA